MLEAIAVHLGEPALGSLTQNYLTQSSLHFYS